MASLHDETLAFMQEIGLAAKTGENGKAKGTGKAAKQRKDNKQQQPQQPQQPQQQAQQQAQGDDGSGAPRKRKLAPQKQQAKAANASAKSEKAATHIKFTDGEVDHARTQMQKQKPKQTLQQAQRHAPQQQQQQQQRQQAVRTGVVLFPQAEGAKKWYNVKADGDKQEQGEGDKKSKQHSRKKPFKKQLTYVQMEDIRTSAEEHWQAETEAYAAQKKQQQSADDKWVQGVISSGTLSDKIAALTLLIQQSPIHNSQLLDNLVNMSTKKERRMAELATRALKDLLINDLLPDRRLTRFEQRLQEAGSELSTRESILYIFEDHLKLKYGELLRALEEGMKDTIESHRRFCLDVCFDLLVSKPEKEDVLLKLIVNKLGDPMKKIASRALELLVKLTHRHGAMIEAIVDEVQVFLQRPNLGSRAAFNTIIFLSSIRFSQTAQGARAAEKVIGIYFTLFEQNMKGQENEAKIIAALLTGVNRAFPFLRNPSTAFKEKLETLFKIVHTSSFNTAVQALGLIFQLVTGSKQAAEEQSSLRNRFYRALYSILLSKEVLSRTRNTVFLNLMYRAVKLDTNPNRVLAFCKRLCATTLQAPSPIAAACMRLLSVALAAQPTVKSSIVAPEKFESLEHHEAANDDENAEDSNTAVANQPFDPIKREPLFAVQGNPGAWEGALFRSHFHPSVSKMAESFFASEDVSYNGDPTVDFALRTFLDKFTYKNPKQNHAKHARKPTEQAPVNSESFLHQHVQEVSPDAVFFHRYFSDLQHMQDAGLTRKKKKKVAADDDEERALFGGGDEEAEMDRFADELAEGLMRDTAAGSGLPYDDDDDDFSDFSGPDEAADDFGGADVPEDDEDNDDDGDDDDEDLDDDGEAFDMAGMGGADSDDEDVDEGDDAFDDVDAFGDFEEAVPKKAKSKKSKPSKDAPIFAAAEDYEDLAQDIYDNVAAGEGGHSADEEESASAAGPAKRKKAQKSTKRTKLRRT